MLPEHPMRHFSLPVSIAAALLLSASALSAQGVAPSGRDLASWMPAHIGHVACGAVTPYPRAANAVYPLPDGRRASLELHEVIGEGREALQRDACRRPITIADRPACLRVRDELASLSWVLDDTLELVLNAPDEATVMQLAGDLDVSSYARTAAHLRSAPPTSAQDGDLAIASGDVASRETPDPPDPEARRRRAERDAVAQVVLRQDARTQACYRDALRRQPALEGSLLVRFTVGPRGRVATLSTSGPIAERAPAVGRCVGALLRGAMFPANVRGEQTLRYRFAPE